MTKNLFKPDYNQRGKKKKPRVAKVKTSQSKKKPLTEMIKVEKAPEYLDKKSKLLALQFMQDSEGMPHPVQVMLENMWWAHTEANDAVDRMFKLIETKERQASVGDDDVADVMSVFKEMVRMRGIAQGCARDAAQYIHPKLGQIDLTSETDQEITIKRIERIIIDSKPDHVDNSKN